MLSLNDGRKELYQWDTGRTASVSIDCDIIHFSNLTYGEALAVQVKNSEVEIPNQLLTSGSPVHCWAFVLDENGSYTKQEQTIDVIKRGKPSDYVYTQTEVITIQAAVENALEKAKESGDFKGDKGDKGEKGEKGDKGDTGEKGATGPKGDKGDAGATGPQGIQGIQGNKGEKGDTGEKGDPGVTPNIKVAKGANIASVGTPTVSASTSGTTTTFTFDYLKGAKGDPGDAGQDYVLTDADKAEIAEEAAKLVTPGTGGGGTSIDVTAEVGQTIVVKEVDANGKPTAWESADYQERTHWKSYDVVEIIPFTTITPEFNSSFQLNVAMTNPFELTEGDVYTVFFDGNGHNCTAKAGSDPMPFIGIGNLAFVGGEDTGEPFLVINVPNAFSGVICADVNSHTINVYGQEWNYHKIPEEYVPRFDYIVRFLYNPTTDGWSVDKEWDDIVAAIKADKNVTGKVTNYGTMGDDPYTQILNFVLASAQILGEGSTGDSMIMFLPVGMQAFSYIIRNGETGEVSVQVNIDY